jgi:hypothetical protein
METTTQKQELLKNLNFEVEKVPLYDPQGKKVEKYSLLRRKDTLQVLNICGSGYEFLQNSELVDIVLEVLPPSLIDSVTTSGSLHGGRRTYMQFKLKDVSFNGDTIERYVTILNSFDGSSSLKIGLGDHVMSCSNQFYRFLRSMEGLSIKHTNRIKHLKEMLSKYFNTILAYDQTLNITYQSLYNTPLHDNLIKDLVQYLLKTDITHELPESSKVSTLLECIQVETQQKGHNLWGLFNGVTRYTTHHTPSKSKSEDNKIFKIMNGSSYKLANKAFQFVTNQIGV